MRSNRGPTLLPNMMHPHAPMHLPPLRHTPHDHYLQSGGLPPMYNMPMMDPGSPLLGGGGGPMDGGMFHDPKMAGGIPGRVSPPDSAWMGGQPNLSPSQEQQQYLGPVPYLDEDVYGYPPYPLEHQHQQPGFYGQPSPHNYDMYHMPYYYNPSYGPPPPHSHHHCPSPPGMMGPDDMGPPASSFPPSGGPGAGGGMAPGPDDHYRPHPGHGHHHQQFLGEYHNMPPLGGDMHVEGFHRGA